MSIREGRWLCQQCGAENLGRYEECRGPDGQQGCGAARATDVKFYLPENSPIVTDPGQLADADSGQDWNCDHCGGANKNAYGGHRVLNCVHCGNSRDAKDPVHQMKDYAPGEVPRTAAAAAPPRHRNVRAEMPLPESGSAGFRFSSRWVGGILAAVIFCFGVWYLVFASFDVSARVDVLSWERTISIEHYRTVTEEDWAVPARGREIDHNRRIRSYNHVLDHYDTKVRQVSEQVQTGTESYNCGTTDLGNGYFQDRTCSRSVYSTRYRTETYQDPVYRDDPVYGIWYTYQIEKWVPARVLRSAGNDQKPYWPDYTLANTNEQVSGKTEQYTVRFQDSKKRQYQKTLTWTDWQKLRLGQSVTVTTDRLGVVLKYVPH